MDYQESQDFSTELEDSVLKSLHEQHDTASTDSPPSVLYIFPTTRRPFFPGMAAPVFVEPGPFYEALKIVSKTPHRCLGIVLTKVEQESVSNVTLNDLCSVGVVARILRIVPMDQGGAQVILSMEGRIRIEKPYANRKKLLMATVSYHKDEQTLSKELKAYSISIISTIKELLKLNPLFKEELQIFLSHSDFTEPGKLADFAVALTTANREDIQSVLETFNIQRRIDKALILLKKEIDVSKLQASINRKIDSSISKTQRDFYLKEQLKTIKRELGLEKDAASLDHGKFSTRIKDKDIPEHVQRVIQEELDKLASLEQSSPEYALCRNYLDWLTIVPWGVSSKNTISLQKAEKILEIDHYGLTDIKKRIIEFIGVSKLSGTTKGSIICFVGPPGVGKTSIGKSIAQALGRQFFRFSVGGMRDEAEIKGHRRTYIGAMPGKIIQALKQCQTMNPVIMLDEIDKLGASYQGDPASALLEVLDPEQNRDFLDHYLDVRCDLSNVLFIVTANVVDTIPAPLLDRMDILRLSGYVVEEKIQIAKRHLIPKQCQAAGLVQRDVSFTDDALQYLIHMYARESGVRSLETNIKNILRKIAVEHVKAKERKKTPPQRAPLSAKDIQKFLGKPIFTNDLFYHQLPYGVTTGLAWTACGGATLYVESIRVDDEKTSMKLTGQAGSVMKESSEIAWSFVHSSLKRYAPKCSFFEKSQVHMHIPEGATPKDGPSAGITMASSLLSLLLHKPIDKNIAMTGELTLTGQVLPVGGIKEKMIAAKRSKISYIIMPKGNIHDFEELPKYIRNGLTVHFVEHYDDVFSIIFPIVKQSQRGSRATKR